jgi:hypothetical protein
MILGRGLYENSGRVFFFQMGCSLFLLLLFFIFDAKGKTIGCNFSSSPGDLQVLAHLCRAAEKRIEKNGAVRTLNGSTTYYIYDSEKRCTAIIRSCGIPAHT